MRWSRRHLYCEIYRVMSVSYNWGKDSCTLTTSIVYIALYSEKKERKIFVTYPVLQFDFVYL